MSHERMLELGFKEVNKADSPYRDYKTKDFIMYILERYGQTDGSHHKAWVIDQIARLQKNCPVRIYEYKRPSGEFLYEFDVGESKKYNDWVMQMRFDEEGDEYDYDVGIAP